MIDDLISRGTARYARVNVLHLSDHEVGISEDGFLSKGMLRFGKENKSKVAKKSTET